MALAAPVISDLLSLGSYAQDLFERCLLAPAHFREAKSELLALQTALRHLEFLTKSPIFAARGGVQEDAASDDAKGASALAIESGDEKLAIEDAPPEEETNGNDAQVVLRSENLEVATVAPNGSANGAHLPPKTRADIAQLAAGCRAVLQSFDNLLNDHQGMNDIPVKPKGRGGGGIMQLFVGRPSGVIDRYHFAQDAVQKINAIRAKLTSHTSSITLMLTVLGNSSLGRIECSLSKLETMIAAEAEERERVHTNNVNYYLLAQQNNMHVTPEKQQYMKLRHQKGLGMGPLEFEHLSEQEYYTSMHSLNGGGMRGGGGRKALKSRGEKQSSFFWGGGRADSADFFANINNLSGRPASSGNLQPRSSSRAQRDKPKEMGLFSGLTRRNTATGAEVSQSKGSSDERKRERGSDWTDSYMQTGWGELRRKSTKSQRLMLPPTPSKSRHTMSGAREDWPAKKGDKKIESSSKRKPRSSEKRGSKTRERKPEDAEPIAAKVEELEDNEEAGQEPPKESEADTGTKTTEEDTQATVDEENGQKLTEEKSQEGGEPTGPAEEQKSDASVKSKHSTKKPPDEVLDTTKRERQRRKREKGEPSSSEPSRKRAPASRPAAPPLPITKSIAKPPKMGWGEAYFLNSWARSERKPVKPIITIPVPKKKTSVVNMRHGTSRAVREEDRKVKLNVKRSGVPDLPQDDDKERRKQKRQHRHKEKPLESKDKEDALQQITEETAPEKADKDSSDSPAKKEEEEGMSPEAAVQEPPAAEKGAEVEAPAEETKEIQKDEGGQADGEVIAGEADTSAAVGSTEDDAAKKERRRKRREERELEEKQTTKKTPRHDSRHKSSKDKDRRESGGKPTDKGKDKERGKEHKEDRDKKETLRRRDTEPAVCGEKREGMSRSKTMHVMEKKGTSHEQDKDVDARRRVRSEKESSRARPQTPTTASAWNKKAILAVAKFTLGGQRPEEVRRRPAK